MTAEREAELLAQNIANIYRAVNDYAGKGGRISPVFDQEDMAQAVAETYLKYLRRCQSEAEAECFPWLDAKHALCELTLAGQTLSYPKSTKDFRKKIHGAPETITGLALDVDGMRETWTADKETEIDFHSFMSRQDDISNSIVSLRLSGGTLREIAEQCDIGKSRIGERLSKLHREYRSFTAEV